MLHPGNGARASFRSKGAFTRFPKRMRGKGRRPAQDVPNPKIFIGGLTNKITEEDLHYEFTKFGIIKTLEIKTGYALLEYCEEKNADEAIKMMNGESMKEGQLIVRKTTLKREKSKKNQEITCYKCGLKGHL